MTLLLTAHEPRTRPLYAREGTRDWAVQGFMLSGLYPPGSLRSYNCTGVAMLAEAAWP